MSDTFFLDILYFYILAGYAVPVSLQHYWSAGRICCYSGNFETQDFHDLVYQSRDQAHVVSIPVQV